MSKHTPGPWKDDNADHDAPYQDIKIKAARRTVCTVWIDDAPCHDFNAEQEANARLIAAAPTQHAEMLRYLPVLERAEADSELWARLTDGLGIATLNGYRAAIKAVEEQK